MTSLVVCCFELFLLLHYHQFLRLLLIQYCLHRVLLYLIWYGSGRFFIESLRTDSLYINLFIAEVKVSQLVALVTVFSALLLLFALRRRTLLTGCGSRAVMELNAIRNELPVAEEVGAEVAEEASAETVSDAAFQDKEEKDGE